MLFRSVLAVCAIAVPFLMVMQAQAAQRCPATHYGVGDGYGGKRTANGERMNPHANTAAHRTLPFGTLVRVCNRGCVTVRINDRGPFTRACIDLAYGPAMRIGVGGFTPVTVERIR